MCTAARDLRLSNSFCLAAKLIEKVAAKRLRQPLAESYLEEQLKSAHSTETARLKVQHDIASSLGASKAAMSVLLDLSAAFDTIDASILFN